MLSAYSVLLLLLLLLLQYHLLFPSSLYIYIACTYCVRFRQSHRRIWTNVIELLRPTPIISGKMLRRVVRKTTEIVGLKGVTERQNDLDSNLRRTTWRMLLYHGYSLYIFHDISRRSYFERMKWRQDIKRNNQNLSFDLFTDDILPVPISR